MHPPTPHTHLLCDGEVDECGFCLDLWRVVGVRQLGVEEELEAPEAGANKGGQWMGREQRLVLVLEQELCQCVQTGVLPLASVLLFRK